MGAVKATVFLIDDDAAIRKSLSGALKKRGFTVETFESALDFLANHEPGRPGCLLLDLNMPGMTGLELQDKLAEAGVEIPIIFMTGEGNIPKTVRAIKAGAIDFLEKPFRTDRLARRIEEAFAADAESRTAREQKEQARERFRRLTQREIEVMQLMLAGGATMTTKEIARELDISHRTVDHHRARIMEKTGTRSVADLARLVSLAGLEDSF